MSTYKNKLNPFTGKLQKVINSETISQIENNIVDLGFRVAINGNYTEFAMSGKTIDEYIDESGIDTASSLNEFYDSVNELYKPAGSLPGGVWLYRKKITIDSTKFDSTETDYPILVKLTSTNFDFTKAKSDGTDIRFTNSDGSAVLKYERNHYDDTAEVAYFWVKVPSVSSSVDTDIYIYYGNASASDGEDAENTWSSDYDAVYHMENATDTTIADSTSNANTGTKDGASNPNEINGEIYKAQQFASSDEIDLGTPIIPATGDWSFSALFYVEPGATSRLIMNQYTSGQAGRMSFVVHSTNKLRIDVESAVYSTGDVGTGWHVLGVKRTGNVYQLYIDGSPDGSGTIDKSIYQGTNTVLGDHGGGFGVGRLDEARFCNVAKSDAWFKAVYNSWQDNLNSFGTEGTPGVEDMTLISEAYSVATAPSEMRLVIREEDVDSVTLNTDLLAYVSRDDGTTYTQATLAVDNTFDANSRILSGGADVSSQPSGTDLVYKIVTANNKNLKIHATSRLWS